MQETQHGDLRQFDVDNNDVTSLGDVFSGALQLGTIPARTVVERVLLAIKTSGTVDGTFSVDVARGTVEEKYTLGGNGKAAVGALYGHTAASTGAFNTGSDVPNMNGSTGLFLVLETEDAYLSTVTGFSCSVFLRSYELPE